MYQIHRKNRFTGHRTNYGGTFTIYDGREEAISNGVTNIKFWKDSSIKIGDWIEYPDGKISECCKVYAHAKRKDMGLIISTRLNCFSQSQADVVSTVLPYRCSTTKPKPDTITTSRLEFAEEWLLNGKSIADACRLHLWQSTGYDGKPLSPRSYKSFAYLTISLPWFDELLKRNRLMRDKYMSLVGALNSEGVDEAYIASQLKKDLQGELQPDGTFKVNVKLHINALNNAIELLEANASKKRVPIEAKWQVENPPIPKQIEPANVNALLEGVIHEQRRSETNETSGDKAISTVGEVERSASPVGETERNSAVFIGASN